MEKKELSELTDEEVVIEKQNQKRSKIIHATLIGFLAGIFIFGTVSWSFSSEKHLGFFIPMLIPVFVIYKLVKNSKRNKD